MRTGIIAFVAACVLCVSQVHADFIHVIAGTHDIQAAPGQVVDVMVAGEGRLNVVLLKAMIGNGKGGDAPIFEYVDLTGPGTLFEFDNEGGSRNYFFGGYGYPGYIEAEATTKTPTGSNPPTFVDLDPSGSLLARVTIDASNSTPGSSFDFLLTDIWIDEFGSFLTSEFEGFNGDVMIDNGTLNIIPEPSSLLLMLVGMAGLGMVAVRRRRVA
jgi:hypothetical protein